MIDRPILKVRLREEAQQFEIGSKTGGTGVDEMPNWGTEDWQNVKFLAVRRLKIKGFYNCHALANTGPFVTSMLRLFGLTFSLSALCGLYVVIV